jgi:hypothetical protein
MAMTVHGQGLGALVTGGEWRGLLVQAEEIARRGFVVTLRLTDGALETTISPIVPSDPDNQTKRCLIKCTAACAMTAMVCTAYGVYAGKIDKNDLERISGAIWNRFVRA